MPERSTLRDAIVVGLALRDDDEAPVRLAREIADATGSPLAFVHAYPYEPLIAVTPPRWEREMRERAVAALEQRAASVRGGAEVTVHARPNPSPVRALHEVAEELGASLIVAGGSHREGLGRVTPGGVAERLLHAAPCAVAIAARDAPLEPGGLRRIGVAFVDGPEGADALAIAAGLARRAGGRVRTYTVLENAADEAARAEAILAKARAAIPPDVLEATEVLEGRAADELARVTEDLDLLVCGSRGYGPVRSLLLGGVTWTLAHTARCPLLVVPRAPVPGLRALAGGPARHGGRG